MNSQPKLRLAAGHRHYDHRLSPFIGLEHGYFREEALEDVGIETTGDDDRTVAGLLSGTIDIGLDISPAKVLAANANGAGLVVVGSMQNGVNQVLVAKRSITSIAQLRGKRIHVVEQGTGVDWHPLRILLRKHGIDPDRDVSTVVKAPFPVFENAKRAFDDDIADARMLLFSQVPAIQEAGYPILFNFRDEYKLDYPQRVVVVTKAFLRNSPERILAFMRPLLRGYRFMVDRENAEECMRIAFKYVTDENLGFPSSYPIGFHKGRFTRPADGGFPMDAMRRYIAEEAMEGRIDGRVEAEDVVDLTLAAKAARDLDARFGEGGYA